MQKWAIRSRTSNFSDDTKTMKSPLKISFLFILTIVAFGLTNCKKNWDGDDPIELTITGVINESQTGKPVENVHIYVYKLAGSGFTPIKEVVSQSWTDSNGFYKIIINTTKSSFLYILSEGGKLGYISPSEYTYKVASSFFQYDIGLVIPSYASIKLVNGLPQDSVSVNVSSPQGGGGATARKGIVGSFDAFFYLPAQMDSKIHIKVIRNGKTNIDTITFNIPYYDTVFYRGIF